MSFALEFAIFSWCIECWEILHCALDTVNTILCRLWVFWQPSGKSVFKYIITPNFCMVSCDSEWNLSWFLKAFDIHVLFVLGMQSSGFRLRFLWFYTQNYSISSSDSCLRLLLYCPTCVGCFPGYLCICQWVLYSELHWRSFSSACPLDKAMKKKNLETSFHSLPQAPVLFIQALSSWVFCLFDF